MNQSTNSPAMDGMPARSRLLWWTGLATMLPGLQFVFPGWVLARLGMDVGDPAGMFYARHWGLMALCIGALLIHASRRPGVRGPILLASAVEKTGLALLVALSWNDAALHGMRGAAVFDALCAALYVYLLWRRPDAAEPAAVIQAPLPADRPSPG